MIDNMPAPPRLIDIPEVMRLTSLHRTSIYEVIKRGELTPVKLGGKTVFAEAQVSQWINAKLVSAGVQLAA